VFQTASNFLFPIIDRLTEHTVRAKVFARDFSATLLPRLLDALPSDSNSRFRSFALHQINGDCMVNTSLIQAILDCPVVRNTPWLRLKGLVQQSNFFK
jgi:hypothetical protein